MVTGTGKNCLAGPQVASAASTRPDPAHRGVNHWLRRPPAGSNTSAKPLASHSRRDASDCDLGGEAASDVD